MFNISLYAQLFPTTQINVIYGIYKSVIIGVYLIQNNFGQVYAKMN